MSRALGRSARPAALACVLGFGLGPAAAAAGTDDNDAPARFIAAVRDAGCTMTEEAAAVALAPLGPEPYATVEYVEVLMSAGLASLSDDFSTLTLSSALCAADPARDAETYAAALAAYVPPEVQPPDPDEMLAFLRADLGPDYVRAMAEFHAEETGCALDLSDPAVAAARLVELFAGDVAAIYGVALPLPAAVEAELRVLVDAFLQDPGPAFRREADRLILPDCTP